jgi:hypothetical protein
LQLTGIKYLESPITGQTKSSFNINPINDYDNITDSNTVIIKRHFPGEMKTDNNTNSARLLIPTPCADWSIHAQSILLYLVERVGFEPTCDSVCKTDGHPQQPHTPYMFA